MDGQLMEIPLKKFKNITSKNITVCSAISRTSIMFYKGRRYISLITAMGHEFFYLPPNSPFLNPIENMFSQWKSIVRSFRPNSQNDLMNQIQATTNEITAQNWTNYC
ncbi:hypothetical protein RF11_07912 [Thelohanellus kitauei]|uniref:Tc1-like transposase DDE domain-containing protein n=1 Tax=Thelohanellus kitauei TaxID=669202 RepID=A0A0C2MNM4_THEKT|nr:hypothetical protein RF11_07912 [Thelohanellus kitauei]